MPYPMLHRLEKKPAPARCFYLPVYPKMIMQNRLVFVLPLLLFPSLYSFPAGSFQVTYLLFLFFFLFFLFCHFLSTTDVYLFFQLDFGLSHTSRFSIFNLFLFFCHYLIMPSLLHLFLAFAFFSFKQKVMFAAYETCFFSLSLFLFYFFSLSFFLGGGVVPSLQQTSSLI